MRKSKFFAVLILSLLMVIPLAGCRFDRRYSLALEPQ